jgi:hypothetical protein
VKNVGLVAFGSYSLSFIIMESRALFLRSLQSRLLRQMAPTMMAITPTPPPIAAPTRTGVETALDCVTGGGVLVLRLASAVAAVSLSVPGVLATGTTIVPPAIVSAAPPSVSSAPEEATRSVVGAEALSLVVDAPVLADDAVPEAADADVTLVTSVLAGFEVDLAGAAPAAPATRSLDWKLSWIIGANSV